MLSSSTIVEVESRLQKESQKIDEILRTIQTLDLGLSLLVLLSFLSFLVVKLLISDLSHLFRIAVLNVKSKLTFEQDISRKVFRNFALILLFEIDESLLSSWHHLNPRDFSSSTSCGKIDLELFFSSSNGEILYE